MIDTMTCRTRLPEVPAPRGRSVGSASCGRVVAGKALGGKALRVRALAVSTLLGAVIAGTLGACTGRSEDRPDAPTQRSPAPVDQAPEEPMVVDAGVMAQELDAAIAEARRTAGAARERWREELLRARRDGGDGGTDGAEDEVPGSQAWAVKWAAPVATAVDRGGIEHVWVRPTRWSAQRIEGVLLSSPRRDIGAVAGGTVSFPAADLTDWLRDDGSGREGGFTIAVLERWSRRRP